MYFEIIQSRVKWTNFILFISFVVVLGLINNSKAQTLLTENVTSIESSKLLADLEKNKPSDSSFKEDTVVIIGASYVRSWPIQEIGGMRIINKGVAGEITFEMLQRFKKDVLSVNPKAVIIWGFLNDIHGTQKDNIDLVLAQVRENIEKMVKLAQTNGIEPILATDLTIRGQDDIRNIVASWIGAIRNKKSYQEYVNDHVLDINRWMRKYAKENQILILDLQPLLADDKDFRKKEFATEDGTHISPAAYEKLTAYAKAKVEASGTNKTSRE